MMNFERSIDRHATNQILGGSMPFLQVLIGPRQVGKSTLVAKIANHWEGYKIIETADRVVTPTSQWIEFLWQKAREQNGPVLLAIDEIQKVKGWADAIKLLYDEDRNNPNLRVLLTGSASLSIQTGQSESLAGRYELIRYPHWGYEDCKKHFDWDLSTFLKFGGYPAPSPMIKDIERWQMYIKDSIVEPVLGRDLQALVHLQKPALLRQLFELVMNYPAQEISYQKLLGQLQDRGNSATIKHYLDVLEGGFLIKVLEKFSTNPLKIKSSSPKLLPLAPALVHAFSDPAAIDNEPEWKGRLLEVAVGAHFERMGGEVFYWREGNDEVDFVVKKNRIVIGVEVKSGRRKSERGLMKFKGKFPEAKTVLLDWQTCEKLLSEKPDFGNLATLAGVGIG